MRGSQALADDSRACIVGAGCSGLTTAKALVEAGIAFDCFEKGSALGGNWRYDNDNGMSSAYRSLHIISSKYNMQFSDFPMPDEFPDYGHHSDVLRYFEAYADAFDVRRRISFDSEVVDAHPVDDGAWQVRLKGGESRRYGALIVANGHHWDPRFPSFPGRFDGTELHSHHYKSPDALAGKRVLVVGIGNSACDIAIDLSRVAANVTVSTRHSAWVAPKYLLGRPTDQWTGPITERLPLWARRAVFRTLTWLTVGNQARYGLRKPDHRLLEAHPTLNQEFLSYVGHGRIVVRPDVARLDGDTVHFVDGSNGGFDAIVYATGYNIRFPFLSPDLIDPAANRLQLYRRVVPPRIANLYFVGFIQPLGAIMPLSEIQARWIAGLLGGVYELPPIAQMVREIESYETKTRRRYVASPRHTIQVDFWDYRRQIEREMRMARRRAA